MGFSFLRIEEEIASKRFTSFYRRLQEECPRLVAYPSAIALISFFNDVEQEYAEKDALLSFLITAYRRDGPGRILSGFFIILFRPAIAALYRLARKRNARFDEEEFIQEVCTLLLEIIATAPVRPPKVAMQIVGPLRNQVRSLVNRELGRERRETSWYESGDSENPTPMGPGDYAGNGEVEEVWEGTAMGEGEETRKGKSIWKGTEAGAVAASLGGDHDDVWEIDNGVDLAVSLSGKTPALPHEEHGEQGSQDEENATGEWRRYDLADAGDFLDNLVAAGVIRAGDRAVIYETVIKGRPLKDLATDPREYQRLKKRRQRNLAAIREYLRNSPK